MEFARRKGLVLYDCDNTLMDTGLEFFSGMNKAISFLSRCIPNAEGLEGRFMFHQTYVRREHHVNPHTIWPLTLDALKKEYGLADEHCQEALGIIMGIYKALPSLYTGIVEALGAVRDLGYDQGIVTHAEPEWTRFKIDGHNLGGFFTNQTIVDVRVEKSYIHWKQAQELHGVTTDDDVWAIGDNIRGDLIAAHEAGIPNLIYASFSSGNAITNNGEKPKHAHTATHPSQLPLIIARKIDLSGEGGI